MNQFFAALEGFAENLTETAQQFDRNSTVEELVCSLQGPNVEDATVVNVFQQLADMARESQSLETWCQTEVLLRGVCQGFALGVQRRVNLADAVDVLRLMWLAMPSRELWQYFNSECKLCEAFSLAPKQMIELLITVDTLATSFFASDDIPTIIPDILAEVQKSIESSDPASVNLLHSLCLERKDLCPVIMFQDVVGILLRMVNKEDLQLSALKVILALISGGGPIIVRQLKEVNQLYPIVTLVDTSPNDVFFCVVLDILSLCVNSQDAQNSIRKPLLRSLSLVLGLNKHSLASRKHVIALLKRFIDGSQASAIMEAMPNQACAVHWWARAMMDPGSDLELREQFMMLFCDVNSADLQGFLLDSMPLPTIFDTSTMVDPAIACALQAMGSLETVKMDRVWFCLDLCCLMVFQNAKLGNELARSDKFPLLTAPFKWIRDISAEALYPPSLNGALFVLLRLLVALTESADAVEFFVASPTLLPQVFRVLEVAHAPTMLRGWAALFLGRCVGQYSKEADILKLIESKVGLDHFNEMLDFVKSPSQIPTTLWTEDVVLAMHQEVQNSLVKAFFAQAAPSPRDNQQKSAVATPMDSGLTDLLKMQDRELKELRATKEKMAKEIAILRKVATDEDKSKLVLKLEAAEEAVVVVQEEVTKWRVLHMEEEKARVKERQRFRRREKETLDHLAALVAHVDQQGQQPVLQAPTDPQNLQEIEVLREVLELIHAEVPEARKFLAPIGDVYHEEEEEEIILTTEGDDDASTDDADENVCDARHSTQQALKNVAEQRQTEEKINMAEQRLTEEKINLAEQRLTEEKINVAEQWLTEGKINNLPPKAIDRYYMPDVAELTQAATGVAHTTIHVNSDATNHLQHNHGNSAASASMPNTASDFCQARRSVDGPHADDNWSSQGSSANTQTAAPAPAAVNQPTHSGGVRTVHSGELGTGWSIGSHVSERLPAVTRQEAYAGDAQRLEDPQANYMGQREQLQQQQQHEQQQQQQQEEAELRMRWQEVELQRQQQQYQEEELRRTQREKYPTEEEAHQIQETEYLQTQEAYRKQVQHDEELRKQQQQQQQQQQRQQQQEEEELRKQQLLQYQHQLQQQQEQQQYEEELRKQQQERQQQQQQVQQPLQRPSESGAVNTLAHGWSVNRTPEGHVYYFNHSTGESRWTPPE
eukprot:GEMP01006593.1.p1 GENE.GEMP01006593.1~~GEMP01006593.1.p1  ORF type:complete len:1169 (+),score=350.34 GEMP01006593.1:171-3677(+)